MTRPRRLLLALAGLLLAWVILAAAGGPGANPFAVATDRACEVAGWNPDSSLFRRGTYSFFFLFTVVEAEVVAPGTDRDLLAEIRLRHLPFQGWRVQEFSVRDSPEAPVAVRLGDEDLR